MFEPFGELDSVKVHLDQEGHACDYGYVNFKRFEDALNAISLMNKK